MVKITCFRKIYLLILLAWFILPLMAQEITFNAIPINSSGANNGSINVIINEADPAPPYSFEWIGPGINSNNINNQNLTGLEPGEYCVAVTNEHGCFAFDCISLPDCQEFTTDLNYTVKNASGPEAFDGKINLQPGGGLSPSPYQYEWLTVDGLIYRTEDLVGLEPGLYCVTVTDELCGTVSDCITVGYTCPAVLMLYADIQNACPEQDNGVFNLAPILDNTTTLLGTAPYEFQWNTGDYGAIVSGLAAGRYTTTITDASGCSHIWIGDISEKEISVQTQIKSNALGSDIILSITGGDFITPLSFNWSNGPTTQNNYNLSPGSYTLTITDAGGCQESFSYEIIDDLTAGTPLGCGSSSEESSLIQFSETIETNCGNDLVTIRLNVIGGISFAGNTYRYEWSNGSGDHPLRDLSPGTYCVTVSDVCSQSVSACYTIDESTHYSPITISGETFPSNGAGYIFTTASGGVEPYLYEWSNGATGRRNDNLSSGTYTVTVTDANGNCNTASYTLQNCDLATNPLVFDAEGYCSGEYIRIHELSGQKPFRFQITGINAGNTYEHEEILPYWDNNNFNQFFVPKGRYRVDVYDHCGNHKQNIVDVCEHCGADYDVSENGYSVGNGGIYLNVNCNCSSNCSNSHLSISVDWSKLPNTSTPYTITWPDGGTQTHVWRSTFTIDGPQNYTFSAQELYQAHTVTIDFPNECSVIIPIQLSPDGSDVVIFGGQPGKDYYLGATGCEACIPEPGYFVLGELYCNTSADYRTFFYNPYDINDPCAGGGRLEAYKLVNGVAVLETILIPPNINLPINISELTIDDNLYNGALCIAGVNCLFDAFDIYGVSIDKPLLLFACTGFDIELNDDLDGDGVLNINDLCPETYDVFNICDLDTDGDGIPDDDEQAGCIDFIEEEFDGGCDVNVYCVYENGTRDLIDTRDGDNVRPCRFTNDDGNCTSVRAFCITGCQFEVLEDGGTGTTYNSTGTLNCSNTAIPTCEQLMQLYCSGLGLNASGQNRGRIPEDDLETVSGESSYLVYPNPFIDHLTIAAYKHQKDHQANLLIMNSLGQIIIKEKLSFDKGDSLSYIGGMGELGPGVYLIAVKDGSELLFTQKVVKLDR